MRNNELIVYEMEELINNPISMIQVLVPFKLKQKVLEKASEKNSNITKIVQEALEAYLIE